MSRTIGNSSFLSVGYGTMGLSAFYGPVASEEERLKILDAVFASQSLHWDTANVYGDSEDLIGKWFKRTGKRDQIFLATKFGHVFRDGGVTVDGSPEHVREAVQSSLERLGVSQIDLLYLHRADVKTPIETTVRAMAEFVKAGKVKYLGLSEVSDKTLRRAHAIHPISAVQVEYSPFQLDVEDDKIGLLKTCRGLGIKIVAYSPLGRGLLTGAITSPDQFGEGDVRTRFPRCSEENFPKILKLVEALKEIGSKHGATAGQVAIAWVLAQGNDIIPIPGTTKVKSLEENVAAGKLKLTETDLQEVRTAAREADAAGPERYPASMMQDLFADTPEL